MIRWALNRKRAAPGSEGWSGPEVKSCGIVDLDPGKKAPVFHVYFLLHLSRSIKVYFLKIYLI
jgi:hypothetical protein